MFDTCLFTLCNYRHACVLIGPSNFRLPSASVAYGRGGRGGSAAAYALAVLFVLTWRHGISVHVVLHSLNSRSIGLLVPSNVSTASAAITCRSGHVLKSNFPASAKLPPMPTAWASSLLEPVLPTCLPCPLNHYAPSTGGDGCKRCPWGKVTIRLGTQARAACMCPPGYHTGASWMCFKCSRNTVSNMSGSSSCLECPRPSSFAPKGSTHCECALGYQRLLLSCEQCRDNTYKDKGGDGPCEQCPLERPFSRKGSTSVTECFSGTVSKGFFGDLAALVHTAASKLSDSSPSPITNSNDSRQLVATVHQRAVPTKSAGVDAFTV